MGIDFDKLSYSSKLILRAGVAWGEISKSYKVTDEFVWKLYLKGFDYKEANSFCKVITECGVTVEEAIAFIELSEAGQILK